MISIIKRFKKFILDHNDLIERLSHGGGPGGSKVNKSENCVHLLHKPTGIWVKVHDSRDLLINKHIALKRLTEKVEFKLHGTESKIGRRIDKAKKNKERRKRKYAEKHANMNTSGNSITEGKNYTIDATAIKDQIISLVEQNKLSFNEVNLNQLPLKVDSSSDSFTETDSSDSESS
jgi:peptide chain release factor